MCAFGIFFVDDMDAELRQIAATVKSGGRVAISSFAEDYMEPMRSLMQTRLGRLGVPAPPQIWLRIAREDACRRLFDQAGLRDIAVECRNLGYFLGGASDWWDVVWNAGFRRMLSGLSPGEAAAFRQQHLEEVAALRTEDGIWMDIPVLFTSGCKPG